jgi:hypothetical protein
MLAMEAPAYRLGKPPGEKMLAIAHARCHRRERWRLASRVGETPIRVSITASRLRF